MKVAIERRESPLRFRRQLRILGKNYPLQSVFLRKFPKFNFRPGRAQLYYILRRPGIHITSLTFDLRTRTFLYVDSATRALGRLGALIVKASEAALEDLIRAILSDDYGAPENIREVSILALLFKISNLF